MMDPDAEWIEVPEILEISALAELTVAFKEVGIEFEHRSIKTGVNLHSLYVRPEHVRGAAMILRAYFEIFDPEDDIPFTGDCPVCGEKLVETWACTECELGFRSPVDPEDRLLPWLREHGGFDQP